MQVIFTNEVLADPPTWRWVDRVLWAVEREWHLWRIDDPEAVEQSEWFVQAGREQPFLRMLMELSARRGAWSRERGPHGLVIVVHVKSMMPCALAAPVAADFVREPLIVLVENIDSDGAFLEAVLDALGDETLRALRAAKPPALCYDSPGGNGELTKRLEHHLESAARAGMPRRIVVVTDSDAIVPEKRSKKAAKIAEHCRKRGIFCHVLRKRAIENYLPQEVIEDWASHPNRVNARPLVAALSRLSAQQRDHVPMKKGLPATLEQEEQALYKDLGPTDLALLRRDMGYRDNKWASLYTTHRAHMTATALRERAGYQSDGRTELDDLVDTISSLL